MISSKLLLFSSLAQLFSVSDASPVAPPDHLQLAAARFRARAALAARSDDSDGLDECFSVGAICDLSLNLGERCEGITGLDRYEEQATCRCKNGIVAAKLA